jgi:hypothetical protein
MNNRSKALKIASGKQHDFADRDWKIWEALWPAIETMVDEGAVLVVKVDGGRTTDDLLKRYTVVLSGGKLGDDFFREDAVNLEDVLCNAVVFYAEKVWKQDGAALQER